MNIHCRNVILVALFAGVAACGASNSAETLPMTEQQLDELHEASMNFDLENVEPFLRLVAAKYEGFDDVDTLVKQISSMDVDTEKLWKFAIRHEGEVTPLHIRVFMDDVDAPDLYFYSSAAVAKELQKELRAFADERGL